MAERVLPGQVTDGLRALSTEIDRLDQAAADRYGLNRTDMRALDIIGRAGPLAPTDLADDVKRAHVGAVEAVTLGGRLVEAVDLGAQGAESAGDLAGECPIRHSLPI